MRAQQSGFEFDLFEMAGFTRPSVEDWEARERKARADREREARRERDRQEKRRQEREARRETRYESPWDVLGVQPGAGKTEVRAAWVRACKVHHPDLAGGSPEAMKRVNRAYSDLKGQMR